MKKQLLAALAASAMLFAGCSGNADTKTSNAAGETTTTGYGDHDGQEVQATVTTKDGKITKVVLDEITEDGDSKKDLGADYNMKAASSIGKEWNEQVEFLENYIAENGVDGIELDEAGKATNEDVLSGCTISIKGMIDAIDDAQK